MATITTHEFVLWGKPYWLEGRIKIMAGTLAECRKAEKQRAKEEWHGMETGLVWSNLEIKRFGA